MGKKGNKISFLLSYKNNKLVFSSIINNPDGSKLKSDRLTFNSGSDHKTLDRILDIKNIIESEDNLE